jgi:methylmalonyl-CoA/ethylmalonyl-CoA epimerase
MKFHHIGIATSNIMKTIEFYDQLGYTRSSIYIDTIQKVKLMFASRDGCPIIGLVEPLDISSPVNTLLKKNGVSPYHLCYEVSSIQQSIEMFKSAGLKQISAVSEAVAFEGRLIVFLYNSNYGLIELLQKD